MLHINLCPTGYPIQLLKMGDWITKSATIDPGKTVCICMNFVKPKDTPAFLKAGTLLVFPVGLKLRTEGEGR